MQSRFFANSVAPRVVLMGILTASLILWLPATLASAQTGGDDVQYNAVCQNIIGQIGDINASNNAGQSVTAVGGNGDGTDGVPDDEGDAEGGAAGGDAEAVAEIAQETGVSIEQVNECLNGAVGTDGDDTGTDDTGTDDTGTDGDAAGDTSDEDAVLASTIPDQKVLANTGGPALLLPALGLLLISLVGLRNLLRR